MYQMKRFIDMEQSSLSMFFLYQLDLCSVSCTANEYYDKRLFDFFFKSDYCPRLFMSFMRYLYTSRPFLLFSVE